MNPKSSQSGMRPEMPRQKLALNKKNDSWRESCVDAIDGMATTMSWDGRSSKERKIVNYDLMNSKINPDDFKYVLDPYGYGDKYGGTPGKLRCMNIVRQKVETLIGQEIQRPFDFSIMCVSGEGISAKEEYEKETLFKTAQFLIRKKLGVATEDEEEQNFPSLEEAANSFTSRSDIREQYASAILRNGREDQRLDFKFSEGFEHGLVVGEEIYYVGIVANEPVVRVVNPLYFEWEKGPENKKIEDAGWAREERYMSVSEILDEFSDYLTEKQVRMLDEGSTSYGMMRNTMLPGYAYDRSTINDYNHGTSYDSRSRSSYIRVATCVWKSMKRIGFMTYIDEEGEEQQTIVDEKRRLSQEEKDAGFSIDWQWVNEVWKGTKIGDDIYIDINPTDNQMNSMDNPSECKLPYVGGTYNNNNSQVTSMLDMMKPHQYLYDVVWFRTENEIAKSDGKKLVMDLAQLPTSHGMDMEKWMYYMKELGIMFVNSFEEGRAGTMSQGQLPSFNQFQAVDLTMSQTVQQFMMILAKLEQLIDTISGVSRQAEGQVGQYETATGIQQAMAGSSAIVESYFQRHDEIKRAVLSHYIECSKFAYVGGKKINYITNDLERVSIEVEGEVYIDSDYNVFPTNSNKDKMIKMKLEQLAPIAMQQDKANLSDMVKLLKTDSVSDFEQQLLNGEQNKSARDQQMQEQQERIAQMNIDAQKEADERDHQQKLEEINLKGEWDMRKAIVVAQGFDEDKDRDNDGIPDVVQVGEEQLEAERLKSRKIET
jgi:hypothetical protein